jgi:hypothetical protein
MLRQFRVRGKIIRCVELLCQVFRIDLEQLLDVAALFLLYRVRRRFDGWPLGERCRPEPAGVENRVRVTFNQLDNRFVLENFEVEFVQMIEQRTLKWDLLAKTPFNRK